MSRFVQILMPVFLLGSFFSAFSQSILGTWQQLESEKEALVFKFEESICKQCRYPLKKDSNFNELNHINLLL